jgi:MerR family Zn(II)-responsive transcriptional regulator of zntA
MLINEVAKMTGISKDTIRYYEKIGLITLNKANRNPNNYRYFGNKEIEKLIQIKALKNFSFTLREIKSLFKLDDGGIANCSSLNEIVDKKVQTIEQQIKELKLMKSKLLTAKNQCVGDCREVVETQI